MNQPSRTSLSLLHGMRARDPKQWRRFVALYSPMVYEWCRRSRVSQSDSADVVQEVFTSVSGKIGNFRKEKPGDSFRGWLWTITRSRAMDHFRRLRKTPIAIGGSTANQKVQSVPQVETPDAWSDETLNEDKQAIYLQALKLLETEFEQHTWQAFWKVTINGMPAKDVAAELNMTAGAVYNARYKVLRRLRVEFAEIIDDDDLNASIT